MSYAPHPDDLCMNCGARRGSHMNIDDKGRPCLVGWTRFYPSGKRAADLPPVRQHTSDGRVTALSFEEAKYRPVSQAQIDQALDDDAAARFETHDGRRVSRQDVWALVDRAAARVPTWVFFPAQQPTDLGPPPQKPVVVTTAERAAIQVAAEYWQPDISGAAGRLEYEAVRKTLRGLLERLDQ